mmetsp:Transcript_9128/g.24772  ORF Transcript_9128/g.24772 Transcript_9128/m.24772 type:complete len:173 (-) Transcript_9128:455-973(-)
MQLCTHHRKLLMLKQRLVMGLVLVYCGYLSIVQSKSLATNFIDTFIKERIHLADIVIASSGASKIENGDVILIHARSHVVEMLLRVAHDEGKRFKVVIVDSRPLLEGKHLLRRLAQYGITCTYVLMNALSYVMKDISKVGFIVVAQWSCFSASLPAHFKLLLVSCILLFGIQ